MLWKQKKLCNSAHKLYSKVIIIFPSTKEKAKSKLDFKTDIQAIFTEVVSTS